MTVYNWDKDYNHILRRHRFAVLPAEATVSDFQQIRYDRYYLHVYQTKIEGPNHSYRALQSKEIARGLLETWRRSYYPRNIDQRALNNGSRNET